MGLASRHVAAVQRLRKVAVAARSVRSCTPAGELNPQGLTALALLIDERAPTNEGLVIRLIVNQSSRLPTDRSKRTRPNGAGRLFGFCSTIPAWHRQGRATEAYRA